MNQSNRGIRLAGASWRIVREDPALLALPALALLATAAVGALFFAPAGILAVQSHSAAALIVAGLVGAYPLTFVAIFFRFAFVVILSGRLDGRSTSVRDGLEIAWNRRDGIARWAFVAAVAAILIRALRQIPGLGGLAGSIASALLGAAWGAVTYFVVPVLAIEGTTGRRAVERSAAIFRERWGIELVGVASISAVFVLATLGGVIVCGVAVAAVHTSAIAVAAILFVAVIGLIAAAVAGATVHQTFGLVLYRYATGRPVPAGFSEHDLRAAVQPKRRRRL